MEYHDSEKANAVTGRVESFMEEVVLPREREALESFGVRFQSRLRPSETATASGTVTEIDRTNGTIDVELEATTQRNETLPTGSPTATLSTETEHRNRVQAHFSVFDR